MGLAQGKFPPSHPMLLGPVLTLPAGEQGAFPLFPAVAHRGCGSVRSSMVIPSAQFHYLHWSNHSWNSSHGHLWYQASFVCPSVPGVLGLAGALLQCCGYSWSVFLWQPLGWAGSSAGGASCTSTAHTSCLPNSKRWGRPWLTSLSVLALNLFIMNILISSITMRH